MMNEPSDDLATRLRDVLRVEASRVEPKDDALDRIRSRIAAEGQHVPDYETILAKLRSAWHDDCGITIGRQPGDPPHRLESFVITVNHTDPTLRSRSVSQNAPPVRR